MQSLPQGFKALVLGHSGAIGAALIDALRANPRCGRVVGLSRHAGSSGEPPLDLTDEASIARAAAWLECHAPLHLVVVATGVLGLDGHAPEKRLADLDPAHTARMLAVNAIGPALAIKHLHTLLPLHERALFGVLSARVGSIGDNHKGGWYSYRASKAALNMLLRTAAIEIARKRPLAVLAALHPGTVASTLSAPFVAASAANPPTEAAQNLLTVLDGLPAAGASGSFQAWDGSPVPW